MNSRISGHKYAAFSVYFSTHPNRTNDYMVLNSRPQPLNANFFTYKP